MVSPETPGTVGRWPTARLESVRGVAPPHGVVPCGCVDARAAVCARPRCPRITLLVRHDCLRRVGEVIHAASPAAPRSGVQSLQRVSLTEPPLRPRRAVLIRALASLPPTGQMMMRPRSRHRHRTSQRRRLLLAARRRRPSWTRTSRAHNRWKQCAVCECVRPHECICAPHGTRTHDALARTKRASAAQRQSPGPAAKPRITCPELPTPDP